MEYEYTESKCPYCDKEVYKYNRSISGVDLLVDKKTSVVIAEKGRIMRGREVHDCEGYFRVLDQMRRFVAWI